MILAELFSPIRVEKFRHNRNFRDHPPRDETDVISGVKAMTIHPLGGLMLGL
jgi:hypothetical protein